MKRFMSIFVGFIMLMVVAGCKTGVKKLAYTDTLVIVHFNDTHSQLLPVKKSEKVSLGGVSRRRTLIKRIRTETPNVLVLDAGDINTGSIFSTSYKGILDIEMMNLIGYSLATVGNHEFDYGIAQFKKQVDLANFPFISANIIEKDTKKPMFPPYIITNIAGTSIVIAGLLTSDTGVMNREVAEQLILKNEVKTVSYLINDLKLKETNDILIMLTHIGYSMDLRLARKFPEIDYIVGGHSHSRILRPKPQNDTPTLVLQAGQWGENAGFLKIFLNKGKPVSNYYRLIPVNKKIGNDPEIDKILAEKQAELNKEMDVVIAKADFQLDKPGLGNLIADSMAWKAKVAIAFVNTGGIRTSFPAGDVKVADIHKVSPFDNHLVVFKLKGSDLKRLFAKSLSGAYLYYSAAVKVRMKGSKFIEAKINGKDIDDDKYYKVAASDFIYGGGDGYSLLKPVAKDFYDTGFLCRDVLIEYVKKVGKINKKTIDFGKRASK